MAIQSFDEWKNGQTTGIDTYSGGSRGIQSFDEWKSSGRQAAEDEEEEKVSPVTSFDEWRSGDGKPTIEKRFEDIWHSFAGGWEQTKGSAKATAKNILDLQSKEALNARTKKAADRNAKMYNFQADLYDKVGIESMAKKSREMADKQKDLAEIGYKINDIFDTDKVQDKLALEEGWKNNYKAAVEHLSKVTPPKSDNLWDNVKDPWWHLNGLAQTLPNMVGAYATGFAATIASGGNVFVGAGATFAFSASLEGGSAYMEAIQYGATEEQADRVLLGVGGINGLLETIPVANLINDTPSGKVLKQSLIKRIAKTYIKQGTEEMVTEATQEVIGNLAAKTYNPNNPVFTQAVLEAGILGFEAGGIVGGTTTLMRTPSAVMKATEEDAKKEAAKREARKGAAPGAVPKIVKDVLPTATKPEYPAVARAGAPAGAQASVPISERTLFPEDKVLTIDEALTSNMISVQELEQLRTEGKSDMEILDLINDPKTSELRKAEAALPVKGDTVMFKGTRHVVGTILKTKTDTKFELIPEDKKKTPFWTNEAGVTGGQALSKAGKPEQTVIEGGELTEADRKRIAQQRATKATPVKVSTGEELAGTPLGTAIELERHGGGLFPEASQALAVELQKVRALLKKKDVAGAHKAWTAIKDKSKPDFKEIEDMVATEPQIPEEIKKVLPRKKVVKPTEAYKGIIDMANAAIKAGDEDAARALLATIPKDKRPTIISGAKIIKPSEKVEKKVKKAQKKQPAKKKAKPAERKFWSEKQLAEAKTIKSVEEEINWIIGYDGAAQFRFRGGKAKPTQDFFVREALVEQLMQDAPKAYKDYYKQLSKKVDQIRETKSEVAAKAKVEREAALRRAKEKEDAAYKKKHNLTDTGFSFDYNSTVIVDAKTGKIKSTKRKDYKQGLREGMVRGSVIGQAFQLPIYNLEYDPTQRLRRLGEISEADWRSAGAKAARAIIKEGVAADSPVVYDFGDFRGTLRELAELPGQQKGRKPKPRLIGEQKERKLRDPMESPPGQGDDDYKKKILEGIDDKPLEEFQPQLYEKKPPKNRSWNNPYTIRAQKVWNRLGDAVTGGKLLGWATPQMGRSRKAYAAIKERTVLTSGWQQAAYENFTKNLSKLDSKEKEKLADMFHKHIPVDQQNKKHLQNMHIFLGRLGKRMIEIQDGWEEQGIDFGPHRLMESVWESNIDTYAKSQYITLDPDLDMPTQPRPSVFQPRDRLKTSMFKEKMGLLDWGITAVRHDGGIENRDIGMMKSVNERIGRWFYNKKVTIKDIAKMNEQALLRILPIGKVRIIVAEDAELSNNLSLFINQLGLSEERQLFLRGRAMGWYRDATKEIKLLFGVTEATQAHEAGHGFDFKYGLKDYFFRWKSKETHGVQKRKRVAMKEELRTIADTRWKRFETMLGGKVSEGFKKYTRNEHEKMAEMFSMYTTDKEGMKKIAPTVYQHLEDFIQENAELWWIRDIQPTRSRGIKTMIAAPGNVAARMIKQAKELEKSGVVQEHTDVELEEMGLEAKKNNGWVNQIDFIFNQTANDLINYVGTAEYFDYLVNSDLITFDAKKAKKLGYQKTSTLERGSGSLGPLKDAFVHPDIYNELQQSFSKKVMSGLADSTVWRALDFAMKLWKIGKTAGSVKTVFRNYYSGHLFQTDLAGYPLWYVKNVPTYTVAIKEYVKKGKTYRKWRDAGLFGADYHSVELDKTFLERLEQSRSPHLVTQEEIEKRIEDVQGVPKKDRVARMFSYYGTIDHFARLYLAMSAEADGLSTKEAVYFANAYELDYRFVPDFIEILRSGPTAIFPLISYAYLITPKIFETIMTRPWVLLKYPIILGALTQYSQITLGVDDEELEANKNDWISGNTEWVALLPWRDKYGDLQYLNMNYIFPMSKPDLKDPLTWTMMDPEQFTFLSSAGPPVIMTFTNLRNNYDPFLGREIYDEADPPDKQNEDKMKYVGTQLSPSVVPDFFKWYQKVTGDDVGYPERRPWSTPKQETAKLIGIDLYSGGKNVVLAKIRSREKDIIEYQKKVKAGKREGNKEGVDYSRGEIKRLKEEIRDLRGGIESSTSKKAQPKTAIETIPELMNMLYKGDEKRDDSEVPDILKGILE